MFDPKDLIDMIIAGQNKGTAPMREGRGSGGLGGLGDIMSDILGSAPETRDTYKRSGRQAQRTPQATPDLGDIFGDILGGGSGSSRQAQPSGRAQEDSSGGLKDIFDQMTRGRDQRQQEYQQQKQAPEDYGRGMGSGVNTGDILGKAKDIFIANPTLGAVVLGGLGSLVLGSRSGRSLIGKGIKLGGAAMVGKMAWNAYKKYSEGQMAGGNQDPYRRETHYQDNNSFDPSTFELPEPIEQEAPAPAPQGSGFEPQAQTGANAVLLLKTMIAASATDGEVDRDERKAIIDNLKQLGLDADAMSFIEDEFNSPASVAELANDTPNQQVAAQVYTAARITIHPDTREEVYFLQSLAEALKLPAGLVANIDYAANAAKS